MNMGQESKISEYFQNYGNEDITIDKLHLKEIYESKDKKMVLLTDDIIAKYNLDLTDQITTFKMSAKEERRYLQNPKVLSYDLYGTTELWFLLLSLNEVPSAISFTLNPIRVYRKTIMNRIAKIISLEKKILDENNDYIVKGLLE